MRFDNSTRMDNDVELMVRSSSKAGTVVWLRNFSFFKANGIFQDLIVYPIIGRSANFLQARFRLVKFFENLIEQFGQVL